MSFRASVAAAFLLSAATLGHASTAEAADGPPLTGAIETFEPAAPPAPFPDVTIELADGTKRPLSEIRDGRIALINFWATWCAPCVKELPSLLSLKKAVDGPDFLLITLSIDRGGAHAVTPFLKRLDVADLGIYLDKKGEAFREMGTGVLPSTILIGRDGAELGRYLGPTEWDAPEVEALMRHYIAQGERAQGAAR